MARALKLQPATTAKSREAMTSGHTSAAFPEAEPYTLTARALHRGTAALVLILIPAGVYMADRRAGRSRIFSFTFIARSARFCCRSSSSGCCIGFRTRRRHCCAAYGRRPRRFRSSSIRGPWPATRVQGRASCRPAAALVCRADAEPGWCGYRTAFSACTRVPHRSGR